MMIAIVIEIFFTPMFCSASTSHIEGEAPPTGGVEKEEEEEVFQDLLHTSTLRK